MRRLPKWLLLAAVVLLPCLLGTRTVLSYLHRAEPPFRFHYVGAGNDATRPTGLRIRVENVSPLPVRLLGGEMWMCWSDHRWELPVIGAGAPPFAPGESREYLAEWEDPPGTSSLLLAVVAHTWSVDSSGGARGALARLGHTLLVWMSAASDADVHQEYQVMTRPVPASALRSIRPFPPPWHPRFKGLGRMSQVALPEVPMDPGSDPHWDIQRHLDSGFWEGAGWRMRMRSRAE